MGTVDSLYFFGEGGREGESKDPNSFINVGWGQHTLSIANLLFPFHQQQHVRTLLLGHRGLLGLALHVVRVTNLRKNQMGVQSSL